MAFDKLAKHERTVKPRGASAVYTFASAHSGHRLAGGVLQQFILRAVDPIIPQIAADLSQPVETVALLATAFALPYALMQPVPRRNGRMSWARRGTMFACLVVVTVSTFAGAFAWNLSVLMASRIVSGIVAGGIFFRFPCAGRTGGSDQRATSRGQPHSLRSDAGQPFGLVRIGHHRDLSVGAAYSPATSPGFALAPISEGVCPFLKNCWGLSTPTAQSRVPPRCHTPEIWPP